MPFLRFFHQAPPILINIDHVVGMVPTVGLHDTQNGMETTVKLFTSRSKLDMTFKFGSEEEATHWMGDIAEYVMNPETDTFEILAELV
ncbi:hypothetical protein H8B13_02195 [Hymenobacter sp. BT188]|uniref:hypothetical protein n=1 Tax=Hymenobacter sp. BT188 TaxID=2763504 RepID=UPI001651A287|nr:hypothetical protein [Hymenobacter sp. BT188]MBC6605622.1 hypothetical protein [Hymenobacter sp. BT188]